MLAQLHPLGVIGSAFFVACIFVGADAMVNSVGVPNYIDVVVATSLLCMLVSMLQIKPYPLEILMDWFEILWTTSFWVAAVRIATH